MTGPLPGVVFAFLVVAGGGSVEMNKSIVTNEQDVVMTVREVAEYLKVAPSTVYRLARQGEVPGRKIGGAWRFSRRTIDAWIDRQGNYPLTPEQRSPPAASPADPAPENPLSHEQI
jgi:excisionase family DNA binding protein